LLIGSSGFLRILRFETECELDMEYGEGYRSKVN
jgi:hypothetical protein